MPQSRNHVDDYLARLPAETEEQKFLRAVPWVLDAGPQDHEYLIEALREEAPRLAALPHLPVFSLLTPLYNTPPRLLRELTLSVRCQSYPHWELLLVDDGSPKNDHLDTAREWANRDPRIKLFECEENRGISGARNFAIAQSTGDFLAILDHDDLLHPMALGQFARVLNHDPSLNLVFSNECQIDDEGTRTYGYFYKPHFDLFTLLRANYVCHFTAIRRDILMDARRDGRVFRTEFDGAEDHDLFARVAITGKMKAKHVPLFLYYWRAVPTSCSMSLEAKPEIPERRMVLLDELIPQAYPGATYRVCAPDRMRSECHMTIRLKSLDLGRKPSLLVVIPHHDGPTRLLRALDALERQSHSLDVTVAIVSAPSIEAGTEATIASWTDKPRTNRYERLVLEGPFDPARLTNEAVEQLGAGVDCILMLRPEVELKSPEAIQTMAMQLLADPGCGVVGLKLVGPDGRSVRHAGLKMFETHDGSGYDRLGTVRHPREFVNDEHVILGVSLACAMTRRDTFDRVGGLDEVVLTGVYSDLDFCCKSIESGMRNYYFGTLTAAEHGPDRHEAPSSREFELAALHERHAATLAAWRVRMLVHTVDPIWPLAPITEVRTVYVAHEPTIKPVRYKVADGMNAVLKRLLGPVHGLMKWAMTGTWRGAKRLRGRGPGSVQVGSIYRPKLARIRSTQDVDS